MRRKLLIGIVMIVMAALQACGGGGSGGGGSSSGGNGASSSSSSSSSAATETIQWGNVQGDARHTGFVPGTFDPAKFSALWSWETSDYKSNVNVNSVAVGNGEVFVTTKGDDGLNLFYRLNAQSGSKISSSVLSQQGVVSSPGYYGGTVVFSIKDAGGLKIFGRTIFSNGTSWLNTLIFSDDVTSSPILVDDGLIFAYEVSYNGNKMHAIRIGAGADAWEQMAGAYLDSNIAGGPGMSTPASDGNRIFNYFGNRLEVYDRATGTLLSTYTVADVPPDLINKLAPYYGAPMVTPSGRVVFFAHGIPGDGADIIAPYYPGGRKFIGYDPGTGTSWETSEGYATAPAVSGTVMYAGRDGTSSPTNSRLDAIDVATGTVLWSWQALEADAPFIGNAIVTNNLIFFSTVNHVYAVDLSTHQMVWSYLQGGSITLAGNMLYICTVTKGTRNTDGKVVGVKLK